MISILFVCHGNICRSTMSESVMTYLVKQAGLSEEILIASAATSTEEIGNPPHYGTVSVLSEKGVALVPHRAVQMTKRDYAAYDYLIGMDSANIRNMERICGGDPDGKIHKLLEFAGEPEDISDPWYTGRFLLTYTDVMRGCTALLEVLKKKLKK